MPVPKGFDKLVTAAMKERPEKPKTTEEIWEKFLYIIFMGGKRSDPEIQFIINMLKSKNLVSFDYVLKTDGDDWSEAADKLISERMQRMQDEELRQMLSDFKKELFRITASIKGSARFLKDKNIDYFEKELSTKEKTWDFIESLANNQDVTNIKYTKIIIWLHSIGFANDFCPPSWQTKSFLNSEIGPYYQYYDDDKYFMNKADEVVKEISKKVKKATARDISSAIYYYMALKNSFPRSPVKKKCTPAAILQFLKKKKMSLKDISLALASFDEKEKLIEDLFEFLDQL